MSDPADAWDELCHREALEEEWLAKVIRAAIEEGNFEVVNGPTVHEDGWRTVEIAFPITQLEKDYDAYVKQQGQEWLLMQKEGIKQYQSGQGVD